MDGTAMEAVLTEQGVETELVLLMRLPINGDRWPDALDGADGTDGWLVGWG